MRVGARLARPLSSESDGSGDTTSTPTSEPAQDPSSESVEPEAPRSFLRKVWRRLTIRRRARNSGETTQPPLRHWTPVQSSLQNIFSGSQAAEAPPSGDTQSGNAIRPEFVAPSGEPPPPYGFDRNPPPAYTPEPVLPASASPVSLMFNPHVEPGQAQMIAQVHGQAGTSSLTQHSSPSQDIGPLQPETRVHRREQQQLQPSPSDAQVPSTSKSSQQNSRALASPVKESVAKPKVVQFASTAEVVQIARRKSSSAKTTTRTSPRRTGQPQVHGTPPAGGNTGFLPSFFGLTPPRIPPASAGKKAKSPQRKHSVKKTALASPSQIGDTSGVTGAVQPVSAAGSAPTAPVSPNPPSPSGRGADDMLDMRFVERGEASGESDEESSTAPISPSKPGDAAES